MKITKIIADKNNIKFYFDNAEANSVKITCFSPALGEEKMIASLNAEVKDNAVSIDRLDAKDLLYCRFEMTDANGDSIVGKKYVEEILDAPVTFDYPTADTKKGLQIGNAADALELGVKHAALNVNEGDFMMPEYVEGNTIEFEHDGKVFFINKAHTEKNDIRVKNMSDHGIIITYIVLNSKKWGTTVPDDFWNVIKHPQYDASEEGKGLISEFNVVTDEGVDYYKAFIAFLAQRYTREDQAYGRAVGMIIGNEVNTGYTWCNSGLMTCEEYCKHYTKALRLAYQAACSVYSNMRIYISLDHFWTGVNFDKNPLKYYPSREVLECVNKECTSDGQMPWNIAHHPYPENLAHPDFWNDESATDSPDTYRITFKNLEILAQFLYKEEYLYNGQRRRIILSEQGFNSNWTPESEILQAMAYGRAYKKVMQIPEIDSFILHAYVDNIREFGLNLGILRRKKDSNEIEGKKPIYYVFKAIDKKDNKGVMHWERY